ncbi:MAG: family 1 glycosylhydrolase [Candidatus Omnitrophica bacterium]|nr:family 1 glycosylhydrolase [Candidatus Omnitrophota bacterium]
MRRKAAFFASFIVFLCLSAGIHYWKVRMQNKLTDSGSPFGVLEFLHWNHPWNSFKYPDRDSWGKAVALMKDAGIGFVRMDFLWEDIEPARGEFQFEKYDNIVELLAKNNIKIVGLLNYSAPWASPTGKWNDPSGDNGPFIEYCRKVISRYKDRVKYWEVWNEPDSLTYWVRQDGLKSYCRLLKGVYLAAKAEDPACKVLNGGLAEGLLSVNRLYDNGAKDYFDVLNIHIFESPLRPGAIKAVQAYARLVYKVMERNGDSAKKIWVTEIGCPGVRSGLEVNNWWLGANPDEKQQEEWVRQVFTQLIKEKAVEKVFWAFLRDCDGHWGNGVDYFGLVRWDFSKKPAFGAYKESTQIWNESLEDRKQGGTPQDVSP